MQKYSKIFALILVFVPVFIWAQLPSFMNVNKDMTPASKSVVPEPGAIVSVPGTHISMIPPEHFLISEQLPGFLHVGSSATIQVSEIVGTSYVMIESAFTEESFKEQNFTLIEKNEIETSSGSSGVLYRLRFNSNGVDYERLMLFAGDYNNTIWINANYPAISYKMLYKNLEKSLLTAQYNTEND
jgi:hypothetical protein